MVQAMIECIRDLSECSQQLSGSIKAADARIAELAVAVPLAQGLRMQGALRCSLLPAHQLVQGTVGLPRNALPLALQVCAS